MKRFTFCALFWSSEQSYRKMMLLSPFYRNGTESTGIKWLSQEHSSLWVLEPDFCLTPMLDSWPYFQCLILGLYDMIFIINWPEGELEGSRVACQVISEGKCRKHMRRRRFIFYHLKTWMLTVLLLGPRLNLKKAFGCKCDDSLSSYGESSSHQRSLSIREGAGLWTSLSQHIFDEYQLHFIIVLYVVELGLEAEGWIRWSLVGWLQ